MNTFNIISSLPQARATKVVVMAMHRNPIFKPMSNVTSILILKCYPPKCVPNFVAPNLKLVAGV